MGMYDTIIDANGRQWQTKAFTRLLRRFTIGDQTPLPGDCQVYVVASDDDVTHPNFDDAFATIRAGVLTEVPADRDLALPLVYAGTFTVHNDSHKTPRSYIGELNSLVGADGRTWKTELADGTTRSYRVGDELPWVADKEYQIAIVAEDGTKAFANIRDDVIAELPVERDESQLHLYFGIYIAED
ncbi:MAG TPA: hypothetical protein VFU07_05485 [Candidatus Lumbricidophila sp.]|nr:hypothetical protein [Candidatus Lumbricidophila sp.]